MPCPARCGLLASRSLCCLKSLGCGENSAGGAASAGQPVVMNAISTMSVLISNDGKTLHSKDDINVCSQAVEGPAGLAAHMNGLSATSLPTCACRQHSSQGNMQHILRGLPARCSHRLSLQQSKSLCSPHAFCQALAKRRCCEVQRSLPAALPLAKLEVGRVHASLHHRLLHARQHKLGEACVARVAQASRDEERAEDEEQGAKLAESPKDEGPNAAYIAFSLAAVMTLGIANRVLCALCRVFLQANRKPTAAATAGPEVCGAGQV